MNVHYTGSIGWNTSLSLTMQCEHTDSHHFPFDQLVCQFYLITDESQVSYHFDGLSRWLEHESYGATWRVNNFYTIDDGNFLVFGRTKTRFLNCELHMVKASFSVFFCF